MRLPDINENDRLIMKMRALGYSQEEIGSRMGISQPAVSARIQKIRRQAGSKDVDKTFWDLVIGLGAAYLIAKFLNELGKGGDRI